MRTLTTLLILSTLTACGEKKETQPATKGSASEPAPTPEPPAAPAKAEPPPPSSDGADEVVQLVVKDVGSKALGSQTIDPACVVVTVVPAGEWNVAAAWLKDCGDKTARSILWVYKRKTGKWNEDYVGQPPKCWKGVPPDIAPAVKIATKIPTC